MKKRVSSQVLRLELDDPVAYRNFIRMPPELFQELEQRLAPELQREMREPRTQVGSHPKTPGQ